jgi:hypothetical protein
VKKSDHSPARFIGSLVFEMACLVVEWIAGRLRPASGCVVFIDMGA